MHHLVNQPTIEIFRGEFSMEYASAIYFLILNRISCGYTREEMAFLMGQDENYIKDMEELQIPVGNLELIVHLNWVFRERDLSVSAFGSTISYQFELSIWIENGVRYYQMEYFINEVETIIFFSLMEDIQPVPLLVPRNFKLICELFGV